jgi:hypothetical protein
MGLKAKLCLFLCLAVLMGSARAEYYLVYPAPACVYCVHTRWVAHHYYHHYRHRIVHHRHPCYGTSIYYYAWEPVSACPCANVYDDCGACGHYHRVYYQGDDNWNYDPDLSTGDDDATVHPGMDIDN